VGLASRGGDRFQTYSLGMKQRLGLAYAMLGDPELLFLDEPTNGMDPEGMAEVRELVRSLGTGGRTVLLSSHLLHEVEQVCDSVTIISRGKLIAQGAVADLLRARRSEQVRVKTTDDARARETLSALEWVEDVAVQAGSLLVTAPIARSGDLTSALSQAGVSVTEMAPVQTSLEEYFLEVTGDDSEGAG
jgi:ABC-2 type transport system ATP-binding protein